MVFKAGSKKHLICFEVIPLFIEEDIPDLPVYQWDGYFHLPSACATEFGCRRKGYGGAQRQSVPVLRRDKRWGKSRGDWGDDCLKDFTLAGSFSGICIA